VRPRRFDRRVSVRIPHELLDRVVSLDVDLAHFVRAAIAREVQAQELAGHIDPQPRLPVGHVPNQLTIGEP
jgi:hypothetical protein